MPTDQALPPCLLVVLEKLHGCFTTPGFATFAALLAGLVANTARDTVTGILTGAGLARIWPHDRAHAFFSRASWNPEILGMCLSHLIVRTLLPAGAALTVAVDDTLFKRRGKKVFGAAWKHEDGVGMTLHLEAIPVGFTGRVVLREPKVKEAGA